MRTLLAGQIVTAFLIALVGMVFAAARPLAAVAPQSAARDPPAEGHGSDAAHRKGRWQPL